MGADVIAKGTYKCHHGCVYGECDGHSFEVWYREGFYYIRRGEASYRDGLCLDAGLLDALAEALQKDPRDGQAS
jgi:hypothetical protein